MSVRVGKLARTGARDLGSDLARDRARDLASDLDRAHAHVRVLACDRARECNLNVVLDLKHGRRHHLDYARSLDRVLAAAIDLDLALAHASYLAHDLDHAFAHNLDLDLTRDLARDLARDLDLARALTRALDDALNRDRDHALDHALDHVLARDLTRDLDEAVELLVMSSTGALSVSAGGTPAQSATRVLRCGLRVLPIAARARYREELDSELSDLAAAGDPRRAQIAYALRAAGRMWSLRRALQTASHTKERTP